MIGKAHQTGSLESGKFSLKSKLSLRDTVAYLEQSLNRQYSGWQWHFRRIKSSRFRAFEQTDGTYNFTYMVWIGMRIEASGNISIGNGATEINGEFEPIPDYFWIFMLPIAVVTLWVSFISGNVLLFIICLLLYIFMLYASKRDSEYLLRQLIETIARLEYIYRE